MMKNKLTLLSLILGILLIATLANAETYTFTLRPTETTEQDFNYTNILAEPVNITFSVINLQLVNPSYNGKDDAIDFTFADGTHTNVGTGVEVADTLIIEVINSASFGDYTADINAAITNSTGTTNVVIHNLEITIQENNAPTFTGIEDFELTVGETKEITVAVNDTDNDNLTITWSGHPTGMTITETNDEITISWTPTTAVADTTVTLKADDGFDETTETFVASARMSGVYLDIPDIELGGNNQKREFLTQTFTITNEGSEAVNDLVVQIANSDTTFEITQEPSTSLAPGDSTVIIISIDIPLSQDSGSNNIGELLFTYGGVAETKQVSLITKTNIEFYKDEIEYEVNNDKKKSIEVNENIDVDPGDEVVLKFKIESLIDDVEFDEDDIEVRVECDEFDYDEDQTSTKTLDSEGDKTNEFEFTIDVPYDADDGLQEATITVEAEDENGAMHTIEFEFEFDVDRLKHDIRIVDLRFINNRVEAGETARLEVEIENTGEEDEEKVYIELVNTELDIEQRIGPIEIDSDDSDKKTMIIEIPDDADERDYIFYVTTMYNMNRETDEEYVTLTVYSNGGVTPEPECEYYYWIDSTSTGCGYKQFCGTYMYQGLQTFDTETECNLALTPEPQLNQPIYGEPVSKGIFGENSLTILVVILIIVIIALLVIILIPSKK